jgi:hypothetical protein
MKKDSEWSPGPGVKVSAANRTDGGWVVSAVMSGGARCPAYDTRSNRRHGWCVRHLQDLPAQGAAVKLLLRVARWRCLNPDYDVRRSRAAGCGSVQPPDASYRRPGSCACPRCRRPASRAFDGTPRGAPEQGHPSAVVEARGVKKQAAPPVRVVSVDDWSWRKGSTYGTIMVDLERREVLDVLPDRSAESTAS